MIRRQALLVALLALACSPDKPQPAQPTAPAPAPTRALRLATTTSVDNTGLLGELLPAFQKKTGIEVKVMAVGTGQAMRLAAGGDVDVILVHDPDAEEKFVAAGDGLARRRVMHNDFVLVGPAADPAGVVGGKDAAAALARIAEKKATFVSRGDDSGTHRAERRLWAAAGVAPTGAPWYLEVGQGMMPTLIVASEKQAYALTDRATHTAGKGKIDLAVLVEGDPRFLNIYSVIPVNPSRQPGVYAAGASAFADFLVSPETQALIGRFQKDGATLFTPSANQ